MQPTGQSAMYPSPECWNFWAFQEPAIMRLRTESFQLPKDEKVKRRQRFKLFTTIQNKTMVLPKSQKNFWKMERRFLRELWVSTWKKWAFKRNRSVLGRLTQRVPLSALSFKTSETNSSISNALMLCGVAILPVLGRQTISYIWQASWIYIPAKSSHGAYPRP